MLFSKLAGVFALATSVVAQRPDNWTLCDWYAMKYWNATDNLAINQYNLLNVLVNRFAFGRVMLPDGEQITGFLNPGQFRGAYVNLLPYFNGGLASTNQNGPEGVAVNILTLLDDGIYPIGQHFDPNGINLKQNEHLQHVYPYFGTVLGCTKIGQEGYPAYEGPASVYDVHKYMNLGPNEVGYFINQIGLACKSVGFTDDDVKLSNDTFDAKFNVRCHAPEAIIEHQGLQYNSICSNTELCPVAPENPICPQTQPGTPQYLNYTVSMGLGSSECGANCTGNGVEMYNFTNTTTPMCYADATGNCTSPVTDMRRFIRGDSAARV